MSLNAEITRIENAKDDLKEAIEEKGVTVGDGAIDTYATAVRSIQTGVGTETDPVFTASPAYGITSNDITNWNGKSTFSGSYNDLSNKPTIQDCFIVSITVNGSVLTASHSPSEIKAAVDSGKYAYLKDPLDGIYQIVFVDSTEVIATQIIGHGTNYNASYIKIAIDSQKNITVTESDLLTSHQDISGKLNTSAVKTSTNTTQGNVYDVTYINSMLGNIEALLGGI